jgi:ferritin
MPSTQPSLSTTPELTYGPMGRAMAEPMESDLLKAMQDHLNMERQAHTAYFATAIWFAERELRGFARYFRQESQGEQAHAEKFGDYLLARGQTIELHQIDVPRQAWTSAEDVMASSFLMESDLTSSLQQLYAIAERSGDIRSTVFLDPMVEQQVKSEHELAHLYGRVRFADHQSAALLIIDNELNNGQHQPASLQDNN